MIQSTGARVGVTLEAGHLWPAEFRDKEQVLAPLAAAPWHAEPKPKNDLPVLQVLRGDFFCLPFGGNNTPLGDEVFPPHGETANARWKLEADSSPTCLHLSLRTKIRRGRVDKYVSVADGEPAIYQRHVISGFSGKLPVAHHAMLKFNAPQVARLSTSPIVRGQVFPGRFEEPAQGGYSCLREGASFSSITAVPRADGNLADLSIYPDREGFEDLVMLASAPDLPFAWTAAVVPDERRVWFAIKDPSVFRSTVFWMSNGGRHYAPWNGRHRGVIGLEETTSFFHQGAAESVRPNAWSRAGIPTAISFDPARPTTMNYIMAAVTVPTGFDIVREILPARRGRAVELIAASGKSRRVALDLTFLHGSGHPDQAAGK